MLEYLVGRCQVAPLRRRIEEPFVCDKYFHSFNGCGVCYAVGLTHEMKTTPHPTMPD